MALLFRHARLSEVTQLADLNRAAYPDLLADGVVYDDIQLHSQLVTFPAGQRVAERDGAVVGALSTLIVDEAEALAPHTWAEITGCGTFSTHRPSGNALYLADIYLDPAAQGSGIGARLYEALRALCCELGLKRIVAGGRLWNYHEVATQMPPEDYVAAVVRGDRKDRVLTPQLRARYEVRGILRDYLEDWRSASYATLLDWPNPAFASTAATVKSAAGSPPSRRVSGLEA
jgi:GNAT superfamily N-acetyltransferase